MADAMEGEALAARIGSALGKPLEPSEWFVVDQPRIDAFAAAIDSHEAIHTDPVKAAATRYGGTIAPGFHIAGLLPSMLRQVFRPEGAAGMAYGLDKLRFPSVVRCGSRVRLSGRMEKVEASGPAAIATFALAMEIEGEDKPACVATLLMRYTGGRKSG